MPTLSTIYQWLVSHSTIVSLVTYHIIIAFTTSLEMPDANSSKFYRFFFRFVNTLSANYTRANVSKGPLGHKLKGFIPIPPTK